MSLGHYCMYTSHSLSQIGMDNNNGQIIDFWVSSASKRLNMSTSIKIWILMYHIHFDLDTFYICLDLFGFRFVWIPKYIYHIHLDPKIWQILSSSVKYHANMYNCTLYLNQIIPYGCPTKDENDFSMMKKF